MRNPFRRRRAEPEPFAFAELWDEAETTAAELAEPPPPAAKREPAIHYRVSGAAWTVCGPRPATGSHFTSEPAEVTCGACKRTILWRHAASP